MNLLLSFLGVVFFTSTVHAGPIYTCANSGDSVVIELTNGGRQMSFRSLYHKMTFIKSADRSSENYDAFVGHYPTGNGYAEGVIYVRSINDIIDSIEFDGISYPCKAGAGRLTVSRARRNESSSAPRKEPCKLTSYYNGMYFVPPRVVCDYGWGISITGGGRW